MDRLLLAFLAALAAAAAAFVPAPGPLLWRFGVLAAALLLASRVGSRSRVLDFVHAFLPVLALAMLVNLVGPVIERVNPRRWDAALATVDAGMGSLAPAWNDALGRPDWLTAAASIAYASYFLVPVAIAVALWLRSGRRADFDRYAFTICFVLLASFVAYFLAPATGPRLPGRASPLLVEFLRVAEQNQLDAFPSGHTAVSIAFVAAAWRVFPRLRAALMAIAAAIIFSTVYLSLHYVADVIAGAALAALTLPLAPRLYAVVSSVAAAAASAPERPRPS